MQALQVNGQLGDAGSYLVEKWNAALAGYKAERDRFMLWYGDPREVTLKKLSPEARGRADALFQLVQKFEVAIAKIGNVLQGAGETWDNIRQAVMDNLPSKSFFQSVFGLSSVPGLGIVQVAIGPVAILVLTAAIGGAIYLASRMRNENEAVTLFDRIVASKTPSGTAPTPQTIQEATGAAIAAMRAGDVPKILGLPWYYVAAGAFGAWLMFGRRGPA